ncbi:MAG: hypothetical protein E7122_08805 [Bacteroidales bacterium]|nr:hypothetical protein [Bacteroidales bacterium]
MNRIVCIIIAALLVCSCTLYESITKGDKVVQIGRAALYKTDLEKVIPKGIAPQDSALLAKQYIDSWAIKQLMLQKAEEQLPKDERDVEKLLEDYRTQLLVFRYENKYVEERLDTNVSLMEREEYYRAHQGSFVGKNGVYKGRLVKMQNGSPNMQVMKKLAKSREIEDLEALEQLAYNSAYKYSNFNDNWVDLNIVAKEIGVPLGELHRLMAKDGTSVEVVDTVYTNILQVLEYVAPGEVTPFEYNSGKIKEIIISRRKQELLSALQRDILRDALNNNKIKIIDEDEKDDR